MIEWLGPTLWIPALLAAVPLATLGILLRRSGKSRAAMWTEAEAARRDLRNLQAGMVTVCGRWRPDGSQSGFVDGEGGSVRVIKTGTASLVAGQPVVVHGVATHDEGDASGYREAGRVWVVDASQGFASSDPAILGRRRRSARLRASLGVALFAAGVATAVLGGVLARRADNGELYAPGTDDSPERG